MVAILKSRVESIPILEQRCATLTRIFGVDGTRVPGGATLWEHVTAAIGGCHC